MVWVMMFCVPGRKAALLRAGEAGVAVTTCHGLDSCCCGVGCGLAIRQQNDMIGLTLAVHWGNIGSGGAVVIDDFHDAGF